jgi:hypothetical protein
LVNGAAFLFKAIGSETLNKLKAALARTDKKNTIVFDLPEAVERKSEQMRTENPLRIEFYKRYNVSTAVNWDNDFGKTL